MEGESSLGSSIVDEGLNEKVGFGVLSPEEGYECRNTFNMRFWGLGAKYWQMVWYLVW